MNTTTMRCAGWRPTALSLHTLWRAVSCAVVWDPATRYQLIYFAHFTLTFLFLSEADG